MIKATQDRIFAVCHVLRDTTPFTKKPKGIIDSGAVGEEVSAQRLEPVGSDHQAHSFIRGNWGNEKRSSFGSLKHFREEEQPEGKAA